jgi:hypothetical protein
MSNRIEIENNPDGSMTFTLADVVTGKAVTAVLDEPERRSLLRGIVNGDRDVRGYVVLTPDPNDSGRYDVTWDGVLYADADDANREVDQFASHDYPTAHVGMVLAVLGGPDDQMPARSAKETTR